MAKNLKSMDIEGLVALRTEIDRHLAKQRAGLERQLAAIGVRGEGSIDGKGRRGRPRKGKKVAPKYRSKKDRSLTWAGRGMVPRWMREEMKAGKLKKEAFLIK